MKIQRGQATFIQMLPLLVGVFFTIVIDETVTGITLPLIQKDFDISPDVAQWFSSIYYISNSAFAIPLAHIGDYFGYRKCIQMFFIIAALSQICTFFIPNFYILLLCRFVTGFAYAGANSTRNTLLSQFFNKEEKQKNIFNSVIVNNSLSIIMPILGGVIAQYCGWRYVYLIACIAAIIMFCVSFIYDDFKRISEETQNLNEIQAAHSNKFDGEGTVLITLFMISFCLSFTLLSSKLYIEFGVCFLVAILSLILLMIVENRADNPILPPFIFKRPINLFLYFNGQLYFITTAYNWLVPQVLYHFNQQQTFVGIMTGIQALFCMISSIITPQLVKRFLSKLVIMFSYTGVTICFVLITLFLSNIWATATLYIVSFYFFAIQMQLVFVFIISAVPTNKSSVMAGMPTCSRTIGQSISLCLFSSIQQIVFSESQNFIWSFQVVLIIMIGFALLGIFLAWFLGQLEGEENKIGAKKE